MTRDGLVARSVEEFRARLSRRFGRDLLDVRVFGSHARGEADEDSDVDVFVLLERASWDDRRAVLDVAGTCSRRPTSSSLPPSGG
jgi:predicted nucleotidyltransferase